MTTLSSWITLKDAPKAMSPTQKGALTCFPEQ